MLARCMCSDLVWVLTVAAHAVWLACIGGLAIFMRVCAFGGFLFYFLTASACLTITSLCDPLGLCYSTPRVDLA